MQIRDKPPVIVESDAERLMKGDMIEIRDTILDLADSVADSRGIHIDRILIRLPYYIEHDWEGVTFDIQVSADDDAAFSYWEEVSDAVTEAQERMPETTARRLNDVGVLVYW